MQHIIPIGKPKKIAKRNAAEPCAVGIFKFFAMKKLRNDKITASRSWLSVPTHSCSNFSISVSQAAAHWLQRMVRQGLGFLYSKIRLVAKCVGIAANG